MFLFFLNKGDSFLKDNTLEIHMPEMSEAEASALVGANDRNLMALSSCFDSDISFRSNTFFLKGDEETEKNVTHVLHQLYDMVHNGRMVNEQDVIYLSRMAKNHEETDPAVFASHIVGRTLAGKPVVPKTMGQYRFVKAMEEVPIVFAIGPAGTGKTYLAVIEAVSALKRGDVKRIVLTRPAVEAGENLGFLPGDMKEKVDPYLTPLYDALHAMLGTEKTEVLIEKGTIEIAPLAFMRGRTLDDAFVILDEAQNTTTAQMKMFLTRLGFHSHMVITGDVTQIDLKPQMESGLIQASHILKDIDEIAVLHMSSDDVVRHPLVQKIIERYEQVQKKR